MTKNASALTRPCSTALIAIGLAQIEFSVAVGHF